MITRRFILAAIALLVTANSPALGNKQRKAFALDPLYEPQQVPFPSAFSPGTIIVDTNNRFLYLIETDTLARRYGIGVGKSGLAWSGTAEVAERPNGRSGSPPRK